MTKHFDEKCYELAEHFMEEPAGKWRPEDKNELAALIQETIEDFMGDHGDGEDEETNG
jgi:hypothetical protein